MEKKISRQRKWQIIRQSRHLCPNCGKETHGRFRCPRCNELHNRQNHKKVRAIIDLGAA